MDQLCGAEKGERKKLNYAVKAIIISLTKKVITHNEYALAIHE